MTAPARPARGAGEGVTLGLAAQVGYAGLGQVVAAGVVHRGLLGVAMWALCPRIRLIDTSFLVDGSPANASPDEPVAPLSQ